MKKKVQDNSGLINKATSDVLNKRLFGPGAHRGLHTDFEKFIKEEPLCAKDVQKLLYAYNKIVLHTSLLAFGQGKEISEDIVNTVSDQLRMLMQCAFSAGYMYGRARMEQNFFEIITKEVEEQNFNDLDAMVSEADATDIRPIKPDDLVDMDDEEA